MISKWKADLPLVRHSSKALATEHYLEVALSSTK